jgi:Predicted membrane protein
VILAGVFYIEARDWAAEAALFWLQFNYWGSLLVAAGYIGLVMGWVRWRPEGVITGGLAAVGRTAFTNYLLQTVLATSIFYGHGLGLFGQVSRVEALGVVVAIWGLQVPLSVLWLQRFRYGPVEWIWRWLTYGRREPLVRER